ncbi:RGS domain [Phytophthora cactorum]|nr:RGS domain [Phytophthora cactorum]
MSKKGGNEIQTLVRVLEKGNKDKQDIVIDDIISNPISCGYLLDFCQKQYCAENLNFFMAVDKFKDECGLLDFRDPESVQSCKEMADQIWADFLSLNSPNEVSLPSDDREQTQERMKRPGEYRSKLFDVAMQDAIKTLQKDTLMRFLKAQQYNEMASKVEAVHELIVKKVLDSDNSYQIDMPTVTTLTDEKIAKGNFSLDEILGDKILFREMLDYLEKTENLKCARQIRRYEEMALQMKADDLKDFAWNLYLYFIAPGSPTRCRAPIWTASPSSCVSGAPSSPCSSPSRRTRCSCSSRTQGLPAAAADQDVERSSQGGEDRQLAPENRLPLQV